MGFLSAGHPLAWPDALKAVEYIRKHGVLQFLQIYGRMKDRTHDSFLWGDEIESMVICLDDEKKTAQLSLRAAEILDTLRHAVEEISKTDASGSFSANFLPEFGSFMVEATPGQPYGGTTADLLLVEVNMRARRLMINQVLQPGEKMFTIGAFPLMGVPNFTRPDGPVHGSVFLSDYVTDKIISPHPRFSTLSANIRMRRTGKVDIRIPLFQDKNTAARFGKLPPFAPSPQRAAAVAADAKVADDTNLRSAIPFLPTEPLDPPYNPAKEIHMDAMGFGMGNCCLQVTFQARNIREARHLYDHLAVFSPIMLALTGASPFFHGRVADIDARWTVISQSVDDRTPEERGLKPVTAGSATKRVINKSRYDSIDSFLSLESNFKPKYNDIPLVFDEPSYQALTAAGVDDLLAKHVAHLFIRDPLVIYEERIEIDDATNVDHFENIQSTNWQTVRFKPPPPNSPIGWRVEFRPMEIQLTDFENAAFTVFIALLSRAILFFDLNFYIPMSKVDENLKVAHRRDAVRKEKFLFRKNINMGGVTRPASAWDAKQPASGKAAAASPLPAPAKGAPAGVNGANGISTSDSKSAAGPTAGSGTSSSGSSVDDADDAYEPMSVRDIICGRKPDFPGLVPIVQSYLDIIKCDESTATRKQVNKYLELVSKRATGELLTTAQWYRGFVDRHPAYQHDSVLNHEIVHDLLVAVDGIVAGTIKVPELLGDLYHAPAPDQLMRAGLSALDTPQQL